MNRRDRGGIWRGTPDAYIASCRHPLTHCKHSSNKGAGASSSSMAESQRNFSYHCRGHIDTLPLERTIPEKSCGQGSAVTSSQGGIRDSEVIRHTSEPDNLRVCCMVSISIPRYLALLVSSRSDFCQLIIPRSLQRLTRSS